MPGGSDTQVQFNDAGAFGGSAAFTFNKTTNVITLGVIGTPATIQALDRGTSGAGIALALVGGAANTAGAGGAITVTGGAGVAGTGGAATLRAGQGGATNQGGGANINGGAGGATSGNGGDVTLFGGVPIDGNGGGASFNGADGVGTNRNGGGVTLNTGNKTGSGTVGAMRFLIAGAEIFRLNAAASTGAQTATFVATNKPGSATGAPTLWLPVIISSTTYWVPLFAN